tara:strand:+ start:311 stop:799 length:489 start_codon:yes stop_codon:yes gene_type:complete
MKELILAMMLWIHNATGWVVPEVPNVKFLESMDLRAYAYGCNLNPIPSHNKDICDAREFWELDTKGVPLALYDHVDKIIILNKNFDITTVHDKSVLFHELVHHVQYHNGIDSTVNCQAELEKEAYNLQDKWLQEKYGVTVWDTIKLNRLFFMVITNCDNLMY